MPFAVAYTSQAGPLCAHFCTGWRVQFWTLPNSVMHVQDPTSQAKACTSGGHLQNGGRGKGRFHATAAYTYAGEGMLNDGCMRLLQTKPPGLARPRCPAHAESILRPAGQAHEARGSGALHGADTSGGAQKPNMLWRHAPAPSEEAAHPAVVPVRPCDSSKAFTPAGPRDASQHWFQPGTSL